MSNFILSRAWKDKSVTMARNRLLLISLADQANDDGICWPGINSLSKRICCSRPTVIKGIKELEQLGAIEVFERHRKSHHYIVKVGMSEKQLELARKSIKELTGTEQPRKPVEDSLSKDGFTQTLGKPALTQLSKDGFTQVVKTGLPQPSINHKKEPSNNINSESTKSLTPQQEMFGAICFVLKRNYKVRKDQTSKFAKQFLELEITPDEIKKFYGPDGWWYKVDWRGRQNQLPNEGTILDTFEAAREYYSLGEEGGAGAVSELEDYFAEITNFLTPPAGAYRQEKWIQPCQSILKQYEDVEIAKEKMREALKFARQENYKIADPGSIYKIALNQNGQSNEYAQAVTDESGGYHI